MKPASWSRRERWLAVAVVVALVAALGDYGYRSLETKRLALAEKSRGLQARLDKLPAAPSPTGTPPGDPMALLMDPPGLRLTRLTLEPANGKSRAGVSLGLEGHFNDFLGYLEQLQQQSAGWQWVEVDYQVKHHPLAEIQVRLFKP